MVEEWGEYGEEKKGRREKERGNERKQDRAGRMGIYPEKIIL